jgi:hypothetical protein
LFAKRGVDIEEIFFSMIIMGEISEIDFIKDNAGWGSDEY